MVTVGEFCNRRVVTTGKGETVLEAARRMRVHHVGSVVVVEDRGGQVIPTGIITDRDIVVGVLATASPYMEKLEVGDILAAPLVTAREDESLVDALKRMRAHGVRRMPVVDADGVLVGVLAFDDLIEFFSEELGDLAALLKREQRHEAETRA